MKNMKYPSIFRACPDIAEYSLYTLYVYCVNSVYIYRIDCILRICIHYRHVGYIVYILQPIFTIDNVLSKLYVVYI